MVARLTLDRAARRESFAPLLACDYDRAILTHRALLEARAKPMFEREHDRALA